MGTDSLWVSCRTCGKSISVSARSCPQCGDRRRFGALKWGGVGLVAILALSVLSNRDEPTSKGAETAGSIALVEDGSAVRNLSERQARFLTAVEAFPKRFENASNELQQSALRDERRSAIKDALDGRREVDGWIGTIKRLQTNSEGRAILVVSISPHIDLVTWNNAISDLIDSTLIDKGTPLFNALSNMSIGDKVFVSGIFLSSDDDWIRENSITLRGSMMNPEFLFRFHEVIKQ